MENNKNRFWCGQIRDLTPEAVLAAQIPKPHSGEPMPGTGAAIIDAVSEAERARVLSAKVEIYAASYAANLAGFSEVEPPGGYEL